jgi:hypothetical protein
VVATLRPGFASGCWASLDDQLVDVDVLRARDRERTLGDILRRQRLHAS